MRRFVLALLFVFLLIPSLWADVQVYDSISVPGTPVMLKARTRGRFLARGGEMVGFSVEGRDIGRRLSGGDGFAYLEFTPEKPGLLVMKATSGGDEATGALLVVGKKEQVVLVEVAGALSTGEFSPEERPGAAGAISKLLERYRIIYMSTGLLGASGDRIWLREKDFPQSVVLEWKGKRTTEHLLDLELKVTAAVGGAGFVQAAKDIENIKLFSFEPDSEGTKVRSWDEVIKVLLP